MEGLLDGVKEWSVATVGAWGYLGIFFLMFAEAVVFVIPSEVVMPVAGVLAAEGRMSIGWACLAGTLGSLAGAWFFYAVGALGGRPLLERYGRFVLVKDSDLDRADRFFEKRGDFAVLVSRVFPIVRTLISLPAGVARMPLGRFSVYTFVGSLPWTVALATAGLALGRSWERILPYTDAATLAASLALLGLGVIWLLRRRSKR